MGFLNDKRLPKGDRGIRYDKIKDHKAIFALAGLMAAAAIGLATANLLGTSQVVLIYSLVASAFVNGAAFFVLPPVLAKCNFYMFLVSAMYVQVSGALDYFYTSTPEYMWLVSRAHL